MEDIPADPKFEKKDIRSQHLRVAPYCRVSTDKDEQLSSYEAQIEYYTAKVNGNPDWTMVRLYADEGITGTSTKRRKEFNKLIADCEAGKVDLVITKSVSRFGRNTLDGLQYTRKLKRLGIGVYFEKENVNTLYMDNEMILTFFFSQAQAESESLSGNVKWGHRKNFKDGKVYYQYKSFMGYRKGPNGEPEIDEAQAAIVRRIFARYLMGDSVSQICRGLEADGIKTVRGNDKWTDGVIRGMRQNEKYIGDALLQKTYIADIFSHQAKKNMGQLPKYYVHDCHPAIIDRETFRKVQEEMARRSGKRRTSSKAKTELGKYSGKYAFSELLVCGECGSPYRRQTYMPRGEKYYVWRCLNRMENGTRICKNSPTFQGTGTSSGGHCRHQRDVQPAESQGHRTGQRCRGAGGGGTQAVTPGDRGAAPGGAGSADGADAACSRRGSGQHIIRRGASKDIRRQSPAHDAERGDEPCGAGAYGIR